MRRVHDWGVQGRVRKHNAAVSGLQFLIKECLSPRLAQRHHKLYDQPRLCTHAVLMTCTCCGEAARLLSIASSACVSSDGHYGRLLV